MTSPPISVDITHSKYADRRWPQIRLDGTATVDDTKQRLHHHVGTSPALMQLYGREPAGEWLALNRGDWTLQEYGVKSGWEVHVDGGEAVCDEARLLLDKSTKVTMTDEEYDKRPNTIRHFLKGMKEKGNISIDEKGSEQTEGKERAAPVGLEETQRLFPVGSRCSVSPGDRRGNIAFVGHRRGGIRLGVCLDEPLGSTDGTEGGVKIFDCDGKNYGEWATPEFVQVGDFPPFDPFDEI
eukprot:GHVS01096629.1.p1 GENE.GHVS01096629.1~~GHVS01096629.1.p1  ORF type:complete len:239 (-),score=42.52 GHVS01096629.1:312-1028(-)